MSKFKIGDMVIGNRFADYNYALTKKGFVATVTRVHDNNNMMTISGYVRFVGAEFVVEDKYFDKLDNKAFIKSKRDA